MRFASHGQLGNSWTLSGASLLIRNSGRSAGSRWAFQGLNRCRRAWYSRAMPRRLSVAGWSAPCWRKVHEPETIHAEGVGRTRLQPVRFTLDPISAALPPEYRAPSTELPAAAFNGLETEYDSLVATSCGALSTGYGARRA